MSHGYEVSQKSLELSETMLAGIEHIRSKFIEGHFEEVLPLLQDVTQALAAIQDAEQQMGGEDELVDRVDRLQEGLTQLVLAYEHADWDQAVKAMENMVVPGFLMWREGLERRCRPSVVS
jgi:hypothetical protein